MVHHHRKGEMAHHANREMHKSHHRAKMAAEHSLHAAPHEHNKMPGHLKEHNSIVKDSHQEGISRVMQRKGDMEVGQYGKMMVHEHHKDPHSHGHK